MAKVEGSQAQPKSTKRRKSYPFVVSSWKGQQVVRSKPKPPAGPQSANSRAWVDAFICDNRAVKWADPRSRERAEELAPNTGWYPRDVLVAAMHGNVLRYDGEPKVTTPTANVYHVTPESQPNGSVKTLTPTAMHWDNNNFWDPVTNPQRLTVRSSGLYLVGGRIYWTGSSSGLRDASIVAGDGSIIAGQSKPGLSNGASPMLMVGLWYFNTGEYCYVNSFGNASGLTVALSSFWILAITPEALIP